MSKTEKMTKRVTVKMDANLKAKLQYEAERDMSAYRRIPRISELQAGRVNARRIPQDRCANCQTNVGRPL